MKRIILYFEQNPWVLYLIASVLVLPAFLVNLGLMPLRFDGAFRGLVALEMLYSDNYITPTLNGEFYYNKPPLFNWFILLIYKLTGVYNEFTIRIPVILSIIFIGIAVYVFLHKRFNRDFAMINAFLFMTGGCLFFGYSSLGLTDVTYSFLLLMSFFSLYHFYLKEKLFLAFVLSWLFAAGGYLVKGLPAVAFQVITLVVFMVVNKDFKRLFHWKHILGVFGFLIPLVAYYYSYFRINPDGWERVVYRMYIESAQKSTLGTNSFMDFVEHIARFPLWFWYNLLPYSLLIIFCFRKDYYSQIRANKLLLFSFWAFLFNVLVYWVSPGTDKNMKYMIMLFPMFYLIIYFFYDKFKDPAKTRTKVLHYIFLGLSILFALASLYAPFYKETRELPYISLISILLFVFLAFFSYVLYRISMHKLWVFIIVIIIARIGFNFIMQPVYVSSLQEVEFKKEAIEAGKAIGGEDVYLCTYINEDITFYISREIGRILPMHHKETYDDNIFYIFDHRQMKEIRNSGRDFEIFSEFACEHENKDLFLIKFRE
ncbi:MAG: glycosyltransferase family 39 protein [Bacteroidales bacterium]|nr:glycosyltransferase family 39 protein [Bacteroidales bacterium]MCF8388684.1 glycosyltransferase family 39 protein [Bacteroidales bacterium]MCF8398803.1 glycosyltransferase family 39 protein [Bacteroidales bacterium]